GNHRVIRTRTTFSPAFPAIMQWNYRGHMRSVQSGHMWLPESPWAQGQVSFGAGTATIGGKLTYVQVDYRRHQWYPITASLTVPNGCTSRLDLAEFNAVDWAGYVRRTLS